MHKNIFLNFVGMEWLNKNNPVNISEKDIVLGEYIIARLNNSGCQIHYLTNGNKIIIPKPWLDIFSALNTHSGAQIIHAGNKGDSVDKVIYLMLKFIVLLDSKRGEDALDILGNVGIIKTQEFRDWIEKNCDIKLKPIQFISVDNIIDI